MFPICLIPTPTNLIVLITSNGLPLVALMSLVHGIESKSRVMVLSGPGIHILAVVSSSLNATLDAFSSLVLKSNA